jgi:hypothetical protein
VAAEGHRSVILDAVATVAAPIDSADVAIAEPKYAPPDPTAALGSARGPRAYRPSCPRSSWPGGVVAAWSPWLDG